MLVTHNGTNCSYLISHLTGSLVFQDNNLFLNFHVGIKNAFGWSMFYLILIIVIIALIWGPSYWVKHTLANYSHPEDRYPGPGSSCNDGGKH